MDSLALNTALLLAGLVIGLLSSIAVGACLQGFCEWLRVGSSKRGLGFVMLLLYMPTLAFVWRNKLEEVPAMAYGVLLSSLIFSIAVQIRSFKTMTMIIKADIRYRKITPP